MGMTLIEKLEAAGEGSRELDIEIALAIGWACPFAEGDHAGMTKAEAYEAGNWFSQAPHGHGRIADNPFSTSLDAKLPWENIDEVGCHEVVPGEALGEVWEAWHLDRETNRRTMGAGNTEAIARRCAALKAREGE